MTKEEILRAAFTTVEYPDVVQRTEIYKAMDENTEQRLSEYKEKLKTEIDKQQFIKDLIDSL